MTHTWIRFLVPREWTAEHALMAVGILQQTIDAIWAVHGEEMAVALHALGPESDTWCEVLRDEPTDIHDDDIPY